ncbi:hypothetical protein [Nonomuraea sp. NPDC052265]|uniref:hypothetical protein n=1 Tax=Nonomuraea sp. NPDC052265 TaxID=3364374 RepID=UPI0037C64AB5
MATLPEDEIGSDVAIPPKALGKNRAGNDQTSGTAKIKSVLDHVAELRMTCEDVRKWRICALAGTRSHSAPLASEKRRDLR